MSELAAAAAAAVADAGTLGNDTVCDINSGDTAWVSISFVLVLGMMPALAFFEAGLLRSKNTLSIITQIFSGIAVLSTMWNVFGYSLTFGTDQGGVIGTFDNALFLDVSFSRCSPHAPTIPAAVFALFQMMFAAITPLLMTGSFAERLKFRSFMLIIILWEIFVYYPVAHWIWGNGWLAKLGTLDFAGGIVIHTTAGASCLVGALLLGRRQGFDQYHGEFPPSNVPLAALGAGLLWMGWFGFNAGSALRAGALSTSAIASTQIGSSMCGCVWFFIAWWRHRPSTLAILNGVIAGLAGITPAAGYINSQASLVLGLVLGVASYFSVHFIKGRLRIDDALDVSSVHGLTGIIGALATGLAADASIDEGIPNGVINGGGWWLFGYQVTGVVVAGTYAAAVTFVIMKAIDRFGGLAISEEEEHHGLDHVEHGERAYDHYFDENNLASSQISSPVPMLHAAQNIDEEDEQTALISKKPSANPSPRPPSSLSRGTTPAPRISRDVNTTGSGFFFERTKLSKNIQ
ncbi:ammonium transporter AmtA [Capsaspora owczarzaki ATCC 30864]|uniref:ammonium transporter AmtA n=1 Tax=Capsaspora owczarzaki (strain ATCC 30864) TaxID=595528 RepID=UPI0001FE346C|nr:ammonium transporter AmtA [Capsaspora owczarzaki ATCC 30864]|eukprot:XP_004343545.1 ammonium transporter AmtA [Capsaspora owczarzaki ATCC 30864]